MSNSPLPEPPDSPEPTDDPEALERQRALGARLRGLFVDIVDEPIPAEFTALLDRLDGAERKDGR